MKLSFYFLTILVIPTFLFSQYNVNGVIRDKNSGEPLIGAFISSNGEIVISDAAGKFKLTNNNDNLEIKITYIGYDSIIIKKNLSGNITNLGNIFLNETTKNLEEITITSGKYKRNIEDVTVSMEALKPSFLENNSIKNISDALEKIPGVNFVDGQVNIRGGSGFSYGAGSRVMVLIDNLPALQYDSGYPNWDNLPTEIIERVELLKGAGSSLYGSSAMNGVLNLLTLKAKRKAYLKVNYFNKSYGDPKNIKNKWWDHSPQGHGGSIVFAKKIHKVDVVTSVFLSFEDLYNQHCVNNLKRGSLKLDYHPTDKLSIGVHTNVNVSSKISFLFWKSDKLAYQADTFVYVGSDRKIFYIDPYVSYIATDGSKHLLQARYYSSSNLVTGSKSNFANSVHTEYQFQKSWYDNSLIFTGGVSGIFGGTEAELYGDTIFKSNNKSIFGQLEKTIFKKLILIGGARYETNSISGPKYIRGVYAADKYKTESKPIFRIGANFKLTKYTNLRASWGQGFRYPTIAERFTNTYTSNLYIRPNINLKPEEGYTAEFGVRQGLAFGVFKAYCDFSAFQSVYNNMIEFAFKDDDFPNLYFIAENIGGTIVNGFEFTTGLTKNYGKLNLDFLGGYVYINPKYKNYDKDSDLAISNSAGKNILKYRYKNSIKFDFSTSYYGAILSFGTYYNSFMEGIDKIFNYVIPGVANFRDSHAKGDIVSRMGIGYKEKKLSLMFNIDNLFNREYSVRPGLLEAPRNFTLNLAFTLE